MNKNQYRDEIHKIKKGIYGNYKFGEFIKKLIIREKDDYQKLELIEYLAYYYTNYVTGHYSDEFLEKELIRIGRKYVTFTPCNDKRDNEILMVMTRAGATGGHTAVVNNWIQFDKSRQYSIVFTEGTIKDVPKFLIDTVKESKGKLFFLHKKDKINKAKELLKISDGFEKVVLHVHMYDVVPILSYSNCNWNTPVLFFNHANFLFSLGMSISDCVLNLCEYDVLKTLKYRGGKNAFVLPNPQKVIRINNNDSSLLDKNVLRQEMKEKYNIPTDGKIILSMGTDFKYKKIKGYDFIAFVKEVLCLLPPDTCFFVIGADFELDRWKNLEKETCGRGRALGLLSRSEVSKWMKVADAFVVSFPMVAAGSYEASQQGLPVFALDIIGRCRGIVDGNYYSRQKELIEQLVEVILGNQSYSTTYDDMVLVRKDPIQWCSLLNQIFEQVPQHKVRSIETCNVIGKEEIINYQLLNDEEPMYIRTVDSFNTKNKAILKMLETLFNKMHS